MNVIQPIRGQKSLYKLYKSQLLVQIEKIIINKNASTVLISAEKIWYNACEHGPNYTEAIGAPTNGLGALENYLLVLLIFNM